MNALEKNVVHIEKMSPNRLFNCYCTNITFQCTADLAKTFLDLVKEKYPNGLFEYTPIK